MHWKNLLFDCSEDGIALLTVSRPAKLNALNGETIGANLGIGRWAQPDSDRFPVRLKKGRNVLLVKITQMSGEWGFCVRFGGLRAPIWAVRHDECPTLNV